MYLPVAVGTDQKALVYFFEYDIIDLGAFVLGYREVLLRRITVMEF